MNFTGWTCFDGPHEQWKTILVGWVRGMIRYSRSVSSIGIIISQYTDPYTKLHHIKFNSWSKEMAQIWIMLRLELFTVPGRGSRGFSWDNILPWDWEDSIKRYLKLPDTGHPKKIYNVWCEKGMNDTILGPILGIIFPMWTILGLRKSKSVQKPFAWNWPFYQKVSRFPQNCQSLRDRFQQLLRCGKPSTLKTRRKMMPHRWIFASRSKDVSFFVDSTGWACHINKKTCWEVMYGVQLWMIQNIQN